MDRRTARVYERDAERWAALRTASPRALRRIGQLLRGLPRGALVADLGSGPGWYAASIERRGYRAVALDVSHRMLLEARSRSRARELVQASLGALPFARHSLDAAVAFNTYQHLPPEQLPIAFAHLHHAMRPGGRVDLTVSNLEYEPPSDAARRRGFDSARSKKAPFQNRLFTFYGRDRIEGLLRGAGFEKIRIQGAQAGHFWLWIRAERADTLPDYVRPGLRLLVCGLNPSLRSAATGVPYGRPGNRFWPAATSVGLCPRERDPWAALDAGLGFTDFVKRPTRAASELAADEYRRGLARLEDTVRFFRPKAVCFVGLEGWRRAVDAAARPGWLSRRFGGRPAYLMPSTSGLNAHAKPADFRRHLRSAMRGPG